MSLIEYLGSLKPGWAMRMYERERVKAKAEWDAVSEDAEMRAIHRDLAAASRAAIARQVAEQRR